MAEGKLIVEVYEYTEDVEALPKFEYIPCELDKCLRNDRATLKSIIQQGLSKQPDKLRETVRKVEEAGIDRIEVVYHRPTRQTEPYIELTNVVQLSMADADASRRRGRRQNDIILYGKYRLSEGIDSTRLRDAQRLSLIYTSADEHSAFAEEPEEFGIATAHKEICLNITYLQE